MNSASTGGNVASCAARLGRALFATGFAIVLLLALGLGGCANTGSTTTSSATPEASAPRSPHPVLPFDEAINAAAEEMFRSFHMEGDNGSAPLPFVIDPLIDGATGAQSKGTSYIQDKVLTLVTTKYTRFKQQPFTGNALDSKPLVLIGTLNTINKAAQMKGARSSWWVCVVLVDLKTRKVVARGVALAQLNGVDITPLDYFRDSPAWTPDDATNVYVDNCQKTKVGDPVDPRYLEGLFASALIAQGIEAYDRQQYQQALDLYRTAAQTPGGDQFRLYVGLYLTNQKLGNRAAEDDAFRQLVDYGMRHKRLAVKFLFRPNSTLLLTEQPNANAYDMWMRQIAQETKALDACLEVTGHTTPTGFPPVNQELSVLRAEYIRDRVDTIDPSLTSHIIANGVGSRENLIGTGKDDDSDALDRRVEFKVIQTACSKSIVPEQYNVY